MVGPVLALKKEKRKNDMLGWDCQTHLAKPAQPIFYNTIILYIFKKNSKKITKFFQNFVIF
jgi:hypothetical protein